MCRVHKKRDTKCAFKAANCFSGTGPIGLSGEVSVSVVCVFMCVLCMYVCMLCVCYVCV